MTAVSPLRAARSAIGLTGAVVAAMAAAGAPGALAQQRAPQSAPQAHNDRGAERFATPDGAIQFVIDRSGPAALLRFDGDPEVHVLRPDPRMNARGDQYYRTADGDVVLRFTQWGEMTIFVRNDRMGAPATFAAAAEPLRPPPQAEMAYRERVRQTQQSLIQRVGRTVSFEAPPQADGMAAAVIADAAERAADGMASAAQLPIQRVIFRLGQQPQAVAQGDTLLIVVAPHLGYAGRPSSADIRAAVENRR